MDLAVRRHHLIEEAKAELDIAYEEVKRAEQEMMACEAEYFAKSKHLDGSADALQVLINEKETRQKRCGIAQLYELQRNAIQRFSEISSVFTIVHSAESPTAATDLIRQHLFRADEPCSLRREVREAVGEFASSLWAYTLESSSVENDRKVREAWDLIEGVLTEVRRPRNRVSAS